VVRLIASRICSLLNDNVLPFCAHRSLFSKGKYSMQSTGAPTVHGKIPSKVLARAERTAVRLRQEMNRAQLREALKISRQQLAKILRIDGRKTAKIVKQIDMRISAFAAILRTMGVELKIIASFPDHDIQIRTLSPRRKSRQIASRRSFAPQRRSG
jgi:hypothetical protein